MTNNSENKFSNLNETVDATAQYDKQDIEQNKVVSLFAYLGILILIPVFAAKESKFARFHINQGLVLLIASFAWGIVYGILTTVLGMILLHGGAGVMIFTVVNIILGLLSLIFLVLVIIGIINAVSGKAKELPIIGKVRILK